MFKCFVLNEGGAFIRARKIFSKHLVFVCLLLVVGIFFPYNVQSQTTNLPSKAIHVVYDDSASMVINDNREYLDRWVQAKYAMEVFAAMLQEKDSMYIYYMSHFIPRIGGNVNASAAIEMSGTETAANRVAKIHDYVPNRSHATSFDAVIKAYNDLRNTNADVKWLVVLTDGVFNYINGVDVDEGSINVDEHFSGFVREGKVRIICLAIGDDITEIKNDPNQNIYFEHAKNSNEILKNITGICNRIFNRNILKSYSFDVPMQELFIFAQGEGDIVINNIKGDNLYYPAETPVNVRFSLVPARSHSVPPNSIPKLNGVIARFTDIPKGSFTINIEGDPTVDVYYQPVVNVAIRLHQSGKEISPNDVREGKYKIEFGIIDENGKFFESSLLGNVEYNATIKNNGQTSPIVKSGDNIIVKEGDFSIFVQAHFLDINTAENTIEGSVLPPPTFKERLISFIRQFWYIFSLLAALLLYWILWGRKKRFPKSSMSMSPIIKIEGSKNPKRGDFYIDPFTMLFPIIAEKGTIRALPVEKPIPKLQVRAIDKSIMEIINADVLTPEKLRGTKIKINGMPIAKGSSKIMEISCNAIIETTLSGRDGTMEVYKCYLEKGQK